MIREEERVALLIILVFLFSILSREFIILLAGIVGVHIASLWDGLMSARASVSCFLQSYILGTTGWRLGRLGVLD